MNPASLQIVLSLLLVSLAVVCLLYTRRRQKFTQIRTLERVHNRTTVRVLPVIAGILVFLSVWSLLSALRTDGPTRVPSPIGTLMSAGRLLHNGTLWREFVVSAIRIITGVQALIAAAQSAGMGLAVASSSPRVWVEGNLNRLGLRHHF